MEFTSQVLDHQHGRRDVTSKPAMQWNLQEVLFLFKIKSHCLKTAKVYPRKQNEKKICRRVTVWNLGNICLSRSQTMSCTQRGQQGKAAWKKETGRFVPTFLSIRTLIPFN